MGIIAYIVLLCVITKIRELKFNIQIFVVWRQNLDIKLGDQ